MTLVEVSALTALLAIVLETVIHRRISIPEGLVEAVMETTALVGALIAVIGLAYGMVSYLVDAMIPVQAAEWVTTVIHSKWVFSSSSTSAS